MPNLMGPFLRSTLLAAMSLACLCSCAEDATSPPLLGEGKPAIPRMAADLGLVTLSLQPDSSPPLLTITSSKYFCGGKVLVQRHLYGSGEILDVNSADLCGSFAFSLIYMPASACRPGGLYLARGSYAGVQYTNRTLLGWNEAGQPASPWITPFDAPTMHAATAEQTANDAVEWRRLGGWTYGVDVASPNVPPGCTLETNLELTVLGIDEQDSANARVHRYTIADQNQGGRLTSTVTALTANAPVVTVQPGTATRRIAMQLDALRDARAQASLAFTGVRPEPALTVDAPRLAPAVRVQRPISLDSVASASSIERALLALADEVGAPLRAVTGNTTVDLTLQVSVHYSITPPDQSAPIEATMPVLLVPAQKLALDGRRDCSGSATPLLCAVVAAARTFDQAHAGLPAASRYVFRFMFSRQDQSPVLTFDAEVARSILLGG